MAQVASAEILLTAAGGNAVLKELQDVDSSLGRLASSGNSAGGVMGSFGAGVLGGAVVAGAQLAVGALTSLAGMVGNLASQALDATVSYESMSMSLQSLAAREMVAAGEAASVGDAFESAGGRAAELLEWTQQLAIQSPFSQEGVTAALRMAMNYGFTTEEAQRLTRATIDFAAATGAGTGAMESISRAFGKMRSTGKASMESINMLVDAGVPAMGILADAFNMSGDELTRAFQRGEITADAAIEAITASLEGDFGGAAARTTNTLGGLISSLEDMKEIGLRNLFGGVFEAAQPALVSMAGTLMDNVVPALDNVGQLLGNTIAPFFSTIATYVGPMLSLAGAIAEIATGDSVSGMQNLQTAVMDIGKALGMDPSSILTLVQNVSKLATGDMSPLTDLIPPDLMSSFQSLSGAFDEVRSAIETTMPTIQEQFGAFLDTLGGTAMTNGPVTIDNIASAVSAMADIWREHGPAIVTAISTVAQWLTAVFGGAFTLVSGIVAGTLQLLSGDVMGAFATILTSVETFANSFLSLLGTNITEVRATWATNIDQMGLIISTLWSNMITGVTNTLLTVKTKIMDGITNAKTAVVEQFEEWLSLGQQLVQSIITGIERNASNLWTTIKNIMKSAIDEAIAALQIGSPSKPFLEMGMNIATSFGLGAEKEQPRVDASMAGLMGGAIGAAAGALPSPAGMGGGSGTTNHVTITVMAQSFDDIVREASARGYEFAAVA